MKKFIKSKIREAIVIPSFRLPKIVDLKPEEINAIKNITWNNLSVDDLGGSGKIAHLAITFPFKTEASKGIVVDIQLIRDTVYQIHIHMSENLRGLGLGYKIYKTLVNDLGHLYSGKGSRLNPHVTKIWDKLKNDPDFDCISNQNGDLCMIKNNSDQDRLTNFMR